MRNIIHTLLDRYKLVLSNLHSQDRAFEMLTMLTSSNQLTMYLISMRSTEHW